MLAARGSAYFSTRGCCASRTSHPRARRRGWAPRRLALALMVAPWRTAALVAAAAALLACGERSSPLGGCVAPTSRVPSRRPPSPAWPGPRVLPSARQLRLPQQARRCLARRCSVTIPSAQALQRAPPGPLAHRRRRGRCWPAAQPARRARSGKQACDARCQPRVGDPTRARAAPQRRAASRRRPVGPLVGGAVPTADARARQPAPPSHDRLRLGRARGRAGLLEQRGGGGGR